MVQLDFKNSRIFRLFTCIPRFPLCLSQCIQANCSSPRGQLLTISYPKKVREGMGGREKREGEKEGRERRRNRHFPNAPFSLGKKVFSKVLWLTSSQVPKPGLSHMTMSRPIPNKGKETTTASSF